MSQAAQTIAAMRAQRQRWVPLDVGKALGEGRDVQILLPTEYEVVREFVVPGSDGKMTLSADLDQVKKYTTGWRGVTEADLLGASVGASDPVPFAPELWELAAMEHIDWLRTVARALIDGIVERQKARSDDAKN